MAISTKPLPETGSGAELMAALATGIRSIYQPIVRLADRHVIAYDTEAAAAFTASLFPTLPIRTFLNW